MNFIHNSTEPAVKTYEDPKSVNLRPPSANMMPLPLDPNKPIVTKKLSMVKINLPSFSIADLQIATRSFNEDNLVGEGSFGRVYQAQFDEGKVISFMFTSSNIKSRVIISFSGLIRLTTN